LVNNVEVQKNSSITGIVVRFAIRELNHAIEQKQKTRLQPPVNISTVMGAF
jgi:predicted Ser/Thr protein kinase